MVSSMASETDAAPLRSWAPQPSLQGSHSSRTHQQRNMWSDRPCGVIACFDLRHHIVSHRTFRQVADSAKDHITWMITPWAPSRQRIPSIGARDHIRWMITPWALSHCHHRPSPCRSRTCVDSRNLTRRSPDHSGPIIGGRRRCGGGGRRRGGRWPWGRFGNMRLMASHQFGHGRRLPDILVHQFRAPLVVILNASKCDH